jgi:16S rRNA (uracil1498-N3)-methyltransferase
MLSMAPRFFCDSIPGSGRVTLGGSEAHHLLHVHRGKPGMEVILFDGQGGEYLARIVAVERRDVHLDVWERQEVSRESPCHITLGVALPKGQRQQWLVEKAVELGVAELVPLVTARAVARPAASTLSRLRRTVVESSKQCGRNQLMTITPPLQLTEYLRGAPSAVTCRVLVHPARTGQAAEAPATPASIDHRRWHLAIGPEGGFSDEEISLARDSGWVLASLGPRILRVETAAVALVAGINYGSLFATAGRGRE